MLVTAYGDEVEVTDIEIEKLAEPILVYNLEIEDCHTYFVGEYSVLVHNMCQNDIDRYANFNRRSEVGDGIEGHELLQNAWLKAHNYIKRRGSGMSRDNPSLGLTEELHKTVTKLQRDAGLLNKNNLAGITLNEVISKNVDVLISAKVPQNIIDDLRKAVDLFVSSNKIV